jgi:hypothetical protein
MVGDTALAIDSAGVLYGTALWGGNLSCFDYLHLARVAARSSS